MCFIICLFCSTASPKSVRSSDSRKGKLTGRFVLAGRPSNRAVQLSTNPDPRMALTWAGHGIQSQQPPNSNLYLGEPVRKYEEVFI